MYSGRDPDLLAIVEIAHRRRLDTEHSLESVFEKAKPMLRREPEAAHPVEALELPAELKARVPAMSDPEERIRAMVEFKVPVRSRSSHHR